MSAEVYKRLTDLDGNSPLSHFSYGRALYLEKRYAEALTAFKQAIQVDPDYLLAYLFAGQATEKMAASPDDTAASVKAANHFYLAGHQRATQLNDERFIQQFAALTITAMIEGV